MSWGNGILELGTFVAIITGAAASGFLYRTFNGRQEFSGAIFLALAVIGLLCSFGITRVPAANPRKQFRPNFLGDLWQEIRSIRRDRVLWLAVLGNMYFSFVGALLLQNAILFGTDTLKVGEVHTSYLYIAIAIGIGVGSFAAGYLSGGKIEYGLVPLGAVGMTVFSATLWRPTLTYHGALVHLALLGFFGGFFIVPIAAIMQHRPEKGRKGGVLAAAQPSVVDRHLAGLGCVLGDDGQAGNDHAPNFPVQRGDDDGRHAVHPDSDAGFAAAVCALVRHAHVLPDPH